MRAIPASDTISGGQAGSFGFTCVHLLGEQFSATLSTEELLASEHVAHGPWVDSGIYIYIDYR